MTPASPPLQGTYATVADAMDASAAQFGALAAYVEGDRTVTFAEWIAAADVLAGGLVAGGIRPGDVVAIALPPSIDYAVAFAGIVRAGAVATGLSLRSGPREVASIVARSRPRLALVPDGPCPLPLGEVPTATVAATAGAPPGQGRPAADPSDPVTIVWTSGTTGLPKGAWYDHRNLEAAVHTAGVMTAPFDRRLVTTPLAHAGYMAKLWEQLAWATTLVLCPVPWSAADMLRLMADERITVAGGAPAQWAKLLEQPDLDGADLSALRLGVAATAPALPELVEQVELRCGCPLVVRYAMTESPSITGTEPGDPPEILYRTVGRPQAGISLSLRDHTGAEVPRGEVGRIHIAGPCVMRGYWGDPDLTAETVLDGGWLRSGDLGHLDDAGNLVLAGRVDDLYIRGGYNVHPLAVEHVLVEHPAVAAAAVVGAPAPVLGEIGVAFVVTAPGAEPPTLEELRAWCQDRIADYKAPDHLAVVDALPLTPMMKVDKQALRADAAALVARDRRA